ncbi:PREDICTED: coiled-coil domain-containing protein 69 [Nanorana parkeri]|uniref:coiled-coil domain-containing protein 69 n=1 Tax=Nanorana parkeri TaxID=125878 RepID=UPI000854D439|nr:PREDICTED: coiled-coil domain-containing protein 69 [Nanorana parkeri]
MGCKASRMCCPRSRNKSRQKTKENRQTSQELNNIAGNGSSENLQKIKDYEQEIRNLLQAHFEEKISIEEANKKKLEEQAQELREKAKQDAEADLEKRLAEQASCLKAELDNRFEELKKHYDDEKASLKETYETLTTSLQETVAELSGQLASFQEKMKRVEESVLNQDYKIHIQDHGSPGEFWEQELQSLHFVIEMKSERIREQEKRLQAQQATMDRNVILEEKVHSLQQEIEALRAQAQNQAAMTIRLTEELLDAQVALEKEKQLHEQLQRDKEQHFYRTVNGDGPLPFSLPMTTQDSIKVT